MGDLDRLRDDRIHFPHIPRAEPPVHAVNEPFKWFWQIMGYWCWGLNGTPLANFRSCHWIGQFYLFISEFIYGRQMGWCCFFDLLGRRPVQKESFRSKLRQKQWEKPRGIILERIYHFLS